MSDETPVERRLRRIAENDKDVAVMMDAPSLAKDADAIDCGREAIRLLREFDMDTLNTQDWEMLRVHLLAKCREDGR